MADSLNLWFIRNDLCYVEITIAILFFLSSDQLGFTTLRFCTCGCHAETVARQAGPRPAKIAPEMQADHHAVLRQETSLEPVSQRLGFRCRHFVLNRHMGLPTLPILWREPVPPCGGQCCAEHRNAGHVECVGIAAAEEAHPGCSEAAGRPLAAFLGQQRVQRGCVLPGKVMEQRDVSGNMVDR